MCVYIYIYILYILIIIAIIIIIIISTWPPVPRWMMERMDEFGLSQTYLEKDAHQRVGSSDPIPIAMYMATYTLKHTFLSQLPSIDIS